MQAGTWKIYEGGRECIGTLRYCVVQRWFFRREGIWLVGQVPRWFAQTAFDDQMEPTVGVGGMVGWILLVMVPWFYRYHNSVDFFFIML